jgi:integrase
MKKKKRSERGHIARRGENKYLVRWRTDGKQVSKIVRGDYGRAMAFLAEQLNPKQPEPPSASKRTFASYMTNEWAQYTADNWKASTQTTQGSLSRRHIEPFFGGMMLDEIKPTDIVAYHTKMEADGLSKRTRRNLHAILTCMFTYAVDTLELIENSPMKPRSAPKQDKTEKPALSEFYMTLALTGIRTGEALGLKWADLDFADSSLNIRCAIYRGKETTPKTSDSIRTRPMVLELRQALLNHKTMAAYNQQSDYIFASSSGRPLNPDLLRKTLQTALKSIGVKFSIPHADGLHLLRHTSGSLIYRRSGGDLKTTQEWLGHSSSRITADIYVHTLNSGQRAAAETLSAIFAPQLSPAKEQLN